LNYLKIFINRNHVAVKWGHANSTGAQHKHEFEKWINESKYSVDSPIRATQWAEYDPM